jgi:carbon monoxide dehydrogenase subunit G
MEMQGTRQLKVNQQQAWDALNNPEVLKACIPGCDRIEASGDNEFSMGTALKIGPVSAKFNGKIMLTDMQPPASYTLNFEGQGGVAGFGKGTAKVNLTPNAEGCELSYSVTAQVGGKIAQLGQRLIDGVAKSLSEEFFKRFDAETEKLYPPQAQAVPAEPVATTEPPAQGWPAWVWVAVAVGVGLVIYLAR